MIRHIRLWKQHQDTTEGWPVNVARDEPKSNDFASHAISNALGWHFPSSQAWIVAVVIPIFCASCQSVSLFSYRLTWSSSPSVCMLVGKGLRGCRLAGIWLRDTRIWRCAIPNTSTLPQEGEKLLADHSKSPTCKIAQLEIISGFGRTRQAGRTRR